MQSFCTYFGEMIAQIPLLNIKIHPRTISPLYVLRVLNHFLIRNSNYVVMKPRTISTYPSHPRFYAKDDKMCFQFFPSSLSKALWHSLLALESSSAKWNCHYYASNKEKKESSLERNFKVQVCTIQFST